MNANTVSFSNQSNAPAKNIYPNLLLSISASNILLLLNFVLYVSEDAMNETISTGTRIPASIPAICPGASAVFSSEYG